MKEKGEEGGRARDEKWGREENTSIKRKENSITVHLGQLGGTTLLRDLSYTQLSELVLEVIQLLGELSLGFLPQFVRLQLFRYVVKEKQWREKEGEKGGKGEQWRSSGKWQLSFEEHEKKDERKKKRRKEKKRKEHRKERKTPRPGIRLGDSSLPPRTIHERDTEILLVLLSFKNK